jgi:DNA invertase Pin-like site-specific DNA recombinase
MKTIGYIRVSTDRQEIGPQVQREAIASRFEDVQWYEDIGISGGAQLEDRPGLAQALVALQPGDRFVVYRLDRVARDLMTQLVIEDQVRKAGAVLISCAGEGTGAEGPEAKLFRQILGAIAEFERAMIKARTRAAMAVKRAKGEKMGGQTPFGYVAEAGKLVPDVAEQAVIERIVGWRGDGVTIRGVVDKLNGLGIGTKMGKMWNIRQVQMILQRHGVS